MNELLVKKKYTLIIYIIFIGMFRPAYLSSLSQTIVRVVSVGITLIYVFTKERRLPLNISVLYCFAILASSFLGYRNGYISLRNLTESVLYGACFYALFSLLELVSHRNNAIVATKAVLDISFFYCIITSISILIPAYKDDSGLEVYFWGNKFTSAYLFLVFIGCFYAVYNKNIKSNLFYRLLYFFAIIWSLISSVLMDCSTTIVASLIFLFPMFLTDKVKKVFNNAITFLILTVLSGLFPLFMNSIMSIHWIQYVVANVLGESLNLNFRSVIYKNHLYQLFLQSPIWGFGYNNTGMLNRTNNVFSNAQNGLMDVVLKFGLIGAICLLVICFKCFYGEKQSGFNGIAAYCYSLVFAGCIEITFNWFFLLGLCLALCFSNNYNRTKTKYMIHRKRRRL